MCDSKATLNGKTVIITGANTGIGLETAVDMAQRGARVILACRNPEKGRAAVQVVKKRSKNEAVMFAQLDLASLQSVRDFATRILNQEPRIDILINNAGVLMCPYSKTEDGFELQFGVNHLAHFLLTNLLLDRLKEAPSARIINVSSMGHKCGKINFDDLQSEKSYSKFGAYSQTKLANILFTRSLAQRLKDTKVTAYSLHPGVVRTEIQRHLGVMLVSNMLASYRLTMGDSRICSRGFPEVVLHGALACRKIFHYYHATFLINFCACHDLYNISNGHLMKTYKLDESCYTVRLCVISFPSLTTLRSSCY